MGLSAAAAGQNAGQDADGDSLAEVSITASRIQRNGYEAPTPVTVIGEEQLKSSAAFNIADYVNQLPQVTSNANPRSVQGLAGGSGGANFLDLRGLGPTRTLVLLDGHRVVGSALTLSPDINTIPSGLINRVDVVTGGASAAWGSDAVSGVVNFGLDTNFTGLKAEVRGGISRYGDDGTQLYTLTGGMPFAAGRGHLVASIEYANNDGVKGPAERDWYTRSQGIANPSYTASNGQYQFLVRENVNVSAGTRGGMITAGPLRGLQFNPDGTTSQFQYGNIVSSQTMVGGQVNDLAQFAALDTRLERSSFFTHGSFEFAPIARAYFDLSYAKANAHQEIDPNYKLGNLTIQRDNAYLPASVVAALTSAAPTQTQFTYGTTNEALGLLVAHNTRSMARALAGLTGTWGADANWKYDVYYQYGRSKVGNRVLNDLINTRFTQALDAVVVPLTGGPAGLIPGSIVCRTTLATPTNGCVPVNTFGGNAITQQARDYLIGVSELDVVLEQNVVEASVQGTPFAIWAGDVSIAAGVGYRKEDTSSVSDDLSLSTSYMSGNFKPTIGSYDVKEAFFETVVPLATDRAWAKSLEFNGAFRATRYSTSGSVNTWKLGLTYQPIDDIRLRVNRSRDIRAPNLADLFSGGSVATNNVNDPFRGNASVTYSLVTTGNLGLTPEEAETTGFGVVYRPSWWSSFSASVDYFDIAIEDAITTLPPIEILTRCLNGDTSFCAQVTRNGLGVITQILNRPFNAALQTEKGVDIELNYTPDIARFMDGRLVLRGFGTYVKEKTLFNGVVTTQTAGQIGSPKWRGQIMTAYSRGKYAVDLAARYIGPSVYDLNNGPRYIDFNDIASVVFVDLGGKLALDFGNVSAMEAYFKVNNVLDRSPPVATSITGITFQSNGTNPALYDTIGRYFLLGVRVQF